MSPLKFSFIIGTALIFASCTDDWSKSDLIDDGSISFSVDPAANALDSRSGGDKARLSFISSTKVETSDKPLWLHLEAAENPGVTNSPTDTRALPVTLSSLDEFNVSASIADTENLFINNLTVYKKDNWKPSTTYYWPEKESLTFFCKQTELPSKLTNLVASDKKFTFDFETAKSDDDLTDADVQEDFVMAIHTYSKGDVTNGVANINFKHPLAGICLVEDESLSDEKLHIRKIELSGLYGNGSCEFSGEKTNTVASTWTVSGDKQTFTQTVAENAEKVPVPVSTSKTVKAVANPFMVIPQNDLSDLKVKVTLADGAEHTAALNKLKELQPGKIYVITLSGLDAKYPPVENLQGMAGNGTVSLTWDNPAENPYEGVYQCGVTVVITQKKSSDSDDISVLTKSIHWEDTHPGEYYPSNPEYLDLFAYITSGVDPDDPSKEVTIDTKNYDEFECDVYADYYNTNDANYSTEHIIHQSIPRTTTILPGKNKAKVLFYIPTGGLVDDDDVAAKDWFLQTYTEGKTVTKDQLAQIDPSELSQEYRVLWVPCGVQLRDAGYGTGKPSEIKVGDRSYTVDGLINEVENIIKSGKLAEVNPYYDTKAEIQEKYDNFKSVYAPTIQALGHVPGVYNNPGTGAIECLPDVTQYFTDDDIKAIRDFYNAGGNLLLTTFSIELVYELEVITAVNRTYGPMPNENYPYRPYTNFFNEIKPSAIWFIRPDFSGRENHDHPIYNDLFRCTGKTFPEWDKTEGDNNKNIWDNGNVFVASDGAGTVEMFPLLSMGADACENNNVIFNFEGKQKTMKNFEDDNNACFLGTWGQIDDERFGVAVEFYPGQTESIWPWNHPEGYIRDFWHPSDVSKEEEARIRSAIQNHGRCICIGLGAYEFNNGLKYDGSEVLNKFQSNIQLLTRNAIEHLRTKPNNVK